MVEELVDNACKFSRQGTPVEVELSAEGLLSITDQGRGMTAAEIEQIGAFRQFDRKKHEQQGLGLGLVLVQKLAALRPRGVFRDQSARQGNTSADFFPLREPGLIIIRVDRQNESVIASR